MLTLNLPLHLHDNVTFALGVVHLLLESAAECVKGVTARGDLNDGLVNGQPRTAK